MNMRHARNGPPAGGLPSISWPQPPHANDRVDPPSAEIRQMPLRAEVCSALVPEWLALIRQRSISRCTFCAMPVCGADRRMWQRRRCGSRSTCSTPTCPNAPNFANSGSTPRTPYAIRGKADMCRIAVSSCACRRPAGRSIAKMSGDERAKRAVKDGGQGRVRTYVGETPADLQSGLHTFRGVPEPSQPRAKASVSRSVPTLAIPEHSEIVRSRLHTNCTAVRSAPARRTPDHSGVWRS